MFSGIIFSNCKTIDYFLIPCTYHFSKIKRIQALEFLPRKCASSLKYLARLTHLSGIYFYFIFNVSDYLYIFLLIFLHIFSRVYGGTGMGLAICKKISELLKGEISATSVVGVGSTFTFIFPIQLRESSVVDALIPQMESIMLRPSLRILIVEDNLINRKLVEAYLSRLGYNADIACNGLEALDAVARCAALGRKYDIVFMDIRMPVMDGIEATKCIRDRFSEDMQPRIVALTADALDVNRQECLDVGMDDFLTKPLTLAQISSIIYQAEE